MRHQVFHVRAEYGYAPFWCILRYSKTRGYASFVAPAASGPLPLSSALEDPDCAAATVKAELSSHLFSPHFMAFCECINRIRAISGSLSLRPTAPQWLSDGTASCNGLICFANQTNAQPISASSLARFQWLARTLSACNMCSQA